MARPLIAQTETARVGDKCVRNAGGGIGQKGKIPPAQRGQGALEGMRVLVACIAMGLTRPNVVRLVRRRDSHDHGDSVHVVHLVRRDYVVRL